MPSTSFFDRWSVTYDSPGLQRLAYRPIHNVVLRRLRGLTPSTIVDLGCGTGQLSVRLCRQFPSAFVVGIDLSPGMLGEAAERIDPDAGGHCALVRADAQALPLAPGSVDVVVCTESFHWYRDHYRTLDGLAGIIRPGGRLVIASIAAFTTAGEGMVRRMTAQSGRPIRARPPRDLRRLLQGSGFEVLHQQRIPRFGPAAWPVLTDAQRR